ncbi:response regulator [Bacillota bacterium Meth-B3]
MYKAILVDDEEAVLRGLQNHVNWHRHNVEIVGAFPNGQEAYDFLRGHPVDLVVTDVCTPYMDGIELAKRVRQMYPRTKILFVSGHADVGYLKDALKLDAVDYILKSIDIDEMDQTLGRVVGMIGEEQNREKKLSEMEGLLAQSMPLLRNRRLSALLRESDEDEAAALSELQFLGIPLSDDIHYAVMVVRLENKWQVAGGLSEKERMLFGLKIQSICEEVLARHNSSICFMDRLSEYILIADAEGDDCETAFLEVAASVRERLLRELGAEVSIGISGRFSGILKIRDAYQSACEAIEMRYQIDSELPISVKKYEELDDLKRARERAEKEILEAVMRGDVAAVHGVRRGFMDYVRQIPTLDERQNFLIFLLLLPARLLTNISTREKGVYASQRQLMERFLLCQGPEEQEALLAEAYEEVTILLHSRSQPQPSAVIQHVKEIIGRAYAQRLSVNSLAQEVYLTPTYLCVLFKQQTGKTINEYITLERIRHAKDLLTDSGILLYDVCFMVGYLSPSYFSKLFKKYTGLSPSEYRESAMLGGRRGK